MATVLVGAAALSGSVAAAGTARRSDPAAPTAPVDDALRPTLTADDVPEGAFVPLQEGDATVASFRSFLGRQLVEDGGDLRPGPESLVELGASVDAVAHGTVASATIVEHPVVLGDLTAARIELQLVLDPADLLRGEATMPGDDEAEAAAGQVWHLPLWLGDPALAPAVADMLRTELGSGPVGADAVLFAQQIDVSSPFGGGLTIVDGIVQGGPEIARIARDPEPEPAELTNVQRALEAAGS